jgi:hypothetical protein
MLLPAVNRRQSHCQCQNDNANPVGGDECVGADISASARSLKVSKAGAMSSAREILIRGPLLDDQTAALLEPGLRSSSPRTEPGPASCAIA